MSAHQTKIKFKHVFRFRSVFLLEAHSFQSDVSSKRKRKDARIIHIPNTYVIVVLFALKIYLDNLLY